MALLTQGKPVDNVRFPSLQAYTLKNSTNFFYNSLAAVNPTTGRLEPFGGVSGTILVGPLYDAENAAQDVTGAAIGVGNDSFTAGSGSGGKPQGRCKVDSEVWPAVSVTGLAATTDIGKLVFLNSDDQTLTLTAPATNAMAVGEIVDYSGTGTVGDVLIWSQALRNLFQRCVGASGGGGEWVHLLSQPGSAANSFSAAAASGIGLAIPAPFHGKIVDAFLFVTSTLTGGNMALAPGITPNGGAFAVVTGGVMTLAGADAAKARKQGTSITAANEFHVGDTIDLATTAFTSAPTAGAFDVWIKLQPIVGV